MMNPIRNATRRFGLGSRYLVLTFVVLILSSSAIAVFAQSHTRRRPVTRPVVEKPVQFWYVVERSDTDFGELNPGESRTLDSAVVVRVVSESDWMLSIVPRDTTITSGALTEVISSERLATRSKGSDWRRLSSALPTVIARGRSTPGSGELVVLDLKIELDNRDPVGRFGGQLEIILEPL